MTALSAAPAARPLSSVMDVDDAASSLYTVGLPAIVTKSSGPRSASPAPSAAMTVSPALAAPFTAAVAAGMFVNVSRRSNGRLVASSNTV